MTLRLYNTLTREVEPFTPADPERVTFYTCGPTVYDDAHIGNFRSFLAADVLRRWIESPLCELRTDDDGTHQGPRRVVHVMNITDVGHMTDDASADGGGEDKMAAAGRRLLEAKKAGKLPADASVDPSDPYAIAAFYASRFLEDARKLGLKVAMEAEGSPELMPRATEYVEGMKRVIAKLIKDGLAYTRGTPGARAVYFDVQAYDAADASEHARYGTLSGNTLDQLRAGAGGRVDDSHQQSKKHPADFLLWREDASHVMKWASPVDDPSEPWGEGYPGWHIECTAMSLALLDPGNTRGEIDLHSGGEDNIFPHHECELAQSCAFTGHKRFARHWFHGRFLLVDGEKMSKSRGTFFTARELFERGHEPAAVRLELIKTHYRSNANFTEQGLKDSARTIERWRVALAQCEEAAGDGGGAGEHLAAFASAMHDDLNISGAIAAANQLRNALADGSLEPGRKPAEALRTMDAVLGVLALETTVAAETAIGVFKGVEPNAQVEALLCERRDARASKDFARADAIRDELAASGYAIKDMAGGKVEVSKSL